MRFTSVGKRLIGVDGWAARERRCAQIRQARFMTG